SKDVAAMFAHPRYVIKSGAVVVEEGEIRLSPEGRQFAVKPRYDEAIEDYLRPLFQQHYTMSFENYPVGADRVHGLEVVEPPA
ncbi:MAG TPA: formylmethanofuran dehydrogenase subunit A, partial [Urbifossiella sp.]|nr:formylmethanofuran dehydrogenase subunit A [Urbifossiella sp.]